MEEAEVEVAVVTMEMVVSVVLLEDKTDFMDLAGMLRGVVMVLLEAEVEELVAVMVIIRAELLQIAEDGVIINLGI
jgi:hypothetical protein